MSAWHNSYSNIDKLTTLVNKRIHIYYQKIQQAEVKYE